MQREDELNSMYQSNKTPVPPPSSVEFPAATEVVCGHLVPYGGNCNIAFITHSPAAVLVEEEAERGRLESPPPKPGMLGTIWACRSAGQRVMGPVGLMFLCACYDLTQAAWHHVKAVAARGGFLSRLLALKSPGLLSTAPPLRLIVFASPAWPWTNEQ